MLIFINISNDEFDSMNSDERREFFDKFINSSRMGNHRFFIQTALVDWVNQNIEYFSKEIQHFVGAHLEYLVELNSYQKSLSPDTPQVCLEIQCKNQRAKFDESQNKWTIGHMQIINGNYLDPCQLIVENKRSDGKFYNLVLNSMIEIFDKIVRYVQINSDVISGDGGGIVHRVKCKIEKKNMFCCICDSDMSAPDAEFGETYKSVKRTINEENLEFLGVVHHTPCRESENFLNPKTIKLVLNAYKITNKDSLLDSYQEQIDSVAEKSEDMDIWRFIDIKYEIYEEILGKFNKKVKYEKDISDSFLEHMNSEYWNKFYLNWFEDIFWYLFSQEPSKY